VRFLIKRGTTEDDVNVNPSTIQPQCHRERTVTGTENRNAKRVFKTGEKPRNWGNRKLARDR
jgi:hypothetical protein